MALKQKLEIYFKTTIKSCFFVFDNMSVQWYYKNKVEYQQKAIWRLFMKNSQASTQNNIHYIKKRKRGEDKMIEHEAMMYSILKKHGLYNKREEYIDVCYIGYAKALKKYDSSRSKPTTYIYKCIENELMQCLRKERAIKRQREQSSLDYVYDECGHDLEDLISNDVDIENNFIKKEENIKLFDTIKKLTKKEQYIIKYSFGFGCDERTQSEIAEHLGVRQAQVSRLKDKTLIKMKRMMGNEDNNISE